MPNLTTQTQNKSAAAFDNLHPIWSRFSEEERQRLLADDASALKTVASILLAIVTAGFVAGAVAVWLMS